jgi:hypothetical protein
MTMRTESGRRDGIRRRWCAGGLLPLAFSLIATVTSAAEPVLAEPDITELIAEAPSAADLPNADAVDLYWATTWTVDVDGRVVRREHRVRKLLTNWAVRNLSDRRVAWDDTRQELAVEVCRTFMRDGTEVATPPRGLNEVTPNAVAHAADFLGLRETVISHIGTEPGCVTELVYVVRDLAPPPLPASARFDLAGRYPVLDRRIAAAAPRSIAHAVLGADHLESIAIDCTSDDDGRSLRCETADLPALPAEGGWADRHDIVPHLNVATAASWDELAAAWRNYGRAAASDTTGVGRWLAASDETGAAAERSDLPADLSPLAAVRRVAVIVGDRLATVHPPTGPWSRAPRTVAEILASAAATPWEKGIVAQTLLAARGLTAEIGFFSPGVAFAADVPAAAAFAEVRVVLSAAGENWWLAPQRDEPFAGRCDLPGRTGLLLEASGSGHRTYTVQSVPAKAFLTAVVRPAEDDEDGERPWLAEIEFAASGACWPGDDESDDIAADLAAAVLPAGEVASLDAEVVGPDRGRIRLTARAPALPLAAAGTYTLPVPDGPIALETVVPAGFAPTAHPRETPVYVERTLDWELRWRVILPDSLAVDAAPAAVAQAAGGFHFDRSSGSRGDGWELESRLEVPSGWVVPGAVPDSRAVLIEPLLPASRALVLTHR